MKTKTEKFLEIAYSEAVFKKRGNLGNPKRLNYYLERLFQDVSFSNSRILDVGAGTGVFSFYTSLRGAKQVISLEPELAGKPEKIGSTFKRFKSDLGIDNVELLNSTFQDFTFSKSAFDLILFHNSINHLDESACKTLLDSKVAYSKYVSLFQKAFRLVKNGGKILIADSNRISVYSLLGLSNPFAPTIDWRLHHSPKTWIQIGVQAGFRRPINRWTSINQFGHIGSHLFGNKLISPFHQNHFSLMMEK